MTTAFITPAPKPSASDRAWTTHAALEALAARNLKRGATFTGKDLREWAPDVLNTQSRVESVTHRLITLKLVDHRTRVIKETGVSFGEYTLTAAGEAEIERVRAGFKRKSGPKGPHGVNKTVPATSFVARLWALMRARKLLDAETAASILVDAGGDVRTATRTANKYLRRWASLGNVEVSAQRVNAVGSSNGFKRYVLIKDCGPTPPLWTAKSLAREAAATSSKKAA